MSGKRSVKIQGEKERSRGDKQGMERGAGKSRGGSLGDGHIVVEVQLFREDVVQSVAQPLMIGVVWKVGRESHCEDSSDSEEEEEDEEVMEGSARVCWINTTESTEKLGDVKLIDRAFLHGDIVAKSSEPLGHTGTVVNVEMMVDLKLPNGEIMKDVNSRRLRRVRNFALGDYVIHDMWVGCVDEVVDNVTVLFDDGAKCKVVGVDPDRLVPVSESVMDDSDCPYFQGQKVRSTSASVFKSAKWLKGNWKASRKQGIVVDLEAGSVFVDWIAEGKALGNAQPSVVPNEEQNGKKLVPMFYYSHTNWQLGDRSLPPAQTRSGSLVPSGGSCSDGLPSDGEAESWFENNVGCSPETVDLDSCGTRESCKGSGESWTLHRRKGKQQRRPIKHENKLQKKEKPVEYAVLIANTRTTVDVVWQDGSVSQGVDACSLIPVDHLGDHDFCPEQYVMERGADGEGLGVETRRVGIVKVVDTKERTASVRWLKIVNRPEEPREYESEEVVSVYELIDHPDYSYCLGDVVIRQISTPSPLEDNPASEDSELAASSGAKDISEADPEDKDIDASRKKPSKQGVLRKMHQVKPSSRNLSWFGVITGLQDGDIEVSWADGTVSKVGPQAILIVNPDLDDSSSANSSDLEDAEDKDEAGSWESVESKYDISRRNQGEADERAERIAWDHEQASGLGDEEDLGAGSPSHANVDLGDEEILIQTQDTGQRTCFIHHFDCVKDPLDHHYIGETSQPTNPKRWVKKIQQEWSSLKKNLPDTIYVRVYEDRMALMRAVIVGAAGTPYHDGLFVFDIYMPPEYPSVPPVVYYHSGGLRLNPNLYENGKICLSLLNTWTGEGSEIWHPSTSSILQVLVSIQGLVLNEKPYFNEAGYHNQVGTGEGEKNSWVYNENSFLLSCKSMLYLLRRPPRHFEELIRNHFRRSGHDVQLACRAYLAGAEVGSLKESNFSGIEDRKFGDQSSAGFKLVLKKLVPKLSAAFEELGCSTIPPSS